jgi:hypothetical protein
MSLHFCFPSLGAAAVAIWVRVATPVEVPPDIPVLPKVLDVEVPLDIPVLPKVLDVEVGPTLIGEGRCVAENGV